MVEATTAEIATPASVAVRHYHSEDEERTDDAIPMTSAVEIHEGDEQGARMSGPGRDMPLQDQVPMDLPSTLQYKDQGRDLDSVLEANQQQHPINMTTSEPVQAVIFPVTALALPGGGDGGDRFNPNRELIEPEIRPRAKKRWMILAGLTAILGVAVVLAVVLLLPGGNNESSGDYGLSEDKEQPSSDANVGSELQFDGIAGLVLVLSNLTEAMSAIQKSWFESTLEGHLEELVVASDRPFRTGWSVTVDQQVNLPNGPPLSLWRYERYLQQQMVAALGVACTIRIPYDDDSATSIPLRTDVEKLVRDILDTTQKLFVERLVDTSSISVQQYFQQVTTMTVYTPSEESSDKIFSDNTLSTAVPTSPPSTISPTMLPTRFPTLPPSTAVPTNDPSELVFAAISTHDELRLAVVAYAKDPRPNTHVAKTYGHPIGTW